MNITATPVRAATPALLGLLALPDEALERRLIEFVQETGIKFRSRQTFQKLGWKNGPAPMIARFWRRAGAGVVPSLDALLWDLRAPLMHDEALSCCSVLLWRRLRKYHTHWIGGIESAAIPIIAGILAVNRAAGAPPLSGFYLRKQRKPDGLRRLLEGVPPPSGSRVVLVDDILNKGIAKKALLAYCRNNGLEPAALLVVVDTQNKHGQRLFEPVCPVEALFTKRTVLRGFMAAERQPLDLPTAKAAVIATNEPITVRLRADSPSVPRNLPPVAIDMTPEDVELVKLARDAVLFAALSRAKQFPTLGEDRRGSLGYLPFLGRYLRERGPVFTRISKREFKKGAWFNRLRGCQAVGLFDPEPGTIAEMTVKSAIVSATRARKVRRGAATFHKPVWPEEIGDLSVFVYIVDQMLPTKARTADELISEGHDVHRWGLVAQAEGYRGVVCGDLDSVPDVATQLAAACFKMQNINEIRPHAAGKVNFIRMKGRWLWDPARPKSTFF